MKRWWTVGLVIWMIGWIAFDMIAHLWVIAICMGVLLEYFVIRSWRSRMLRDRERRWVLRERAYQREWAQCEGLRAAQRAIYLELLMSVLTPEQREIYLRDGYIPVEGSDGGRYEIHRFASDNVRAGRDRWCAISPGVIYIEGQMLAQYLALVTDERAFLRVAVHHRVDWYEPL